MKRKHRIPWAVVQSALQEIGELMPGEEIREVTLVKPRGLLLHLELPGKPKTEEE